MDTERYCTTLENINPTSAIRAIHQAYLQIAALDTNVDCGEFDNAPALKALADVLKDAGHPGFVS